MQQKHLDQLLIFSAAVFCIVMPFDFISDIPDKYKRNYLNSAVVVHVFPKIMMNKMTDTVLSLFTRNILLPFLWSK
jgi:hypothetical protein